MNAVHFHLLITHLPIVGSALAALVLLMSIFTNSSATRIAAYVLLIICGIGAGMANKSGEEAEEILEDRPGYDHHLIHEHEEAAEPVFVSMAALAVVAIGGIVLERKQHKFAKLTSFVLLAGSVTCFGLAARVGNLGGMIKHDEIRSEQPSPATHESSEGEEH